MEIVLRIWDSRTNLLGWLIIRPNYQVRKSYFLANFETLSTLTSQSASICQLKHIVHYQV